VAAQARKGWTFLTNHAAVLLTLYEDPEQRLRDIAARVGITERAAHQIVVDLAAEGYVTVERKGRRNRYTVTSDLPARRAAWGGADVMDALRALLANNVVRKSSK
jgi:DNA-binding MarR family transcriptional regulator